MKIINLEDFKNPALPAIVMALTMSSQFAGTQPRLPEHLQCNTWHVCFWPLHLRPTLAIPPHDLV